MLFCDAVDAFLTGYFSTCKRSRKTQAAYRIDLSQLAGSIGAGLELKAIEASRLEQWATELRSKEYATVSVRRKFATARVFFSYWVRRGEIDSSPLWRIRLDLGRERLLPRSLAPSDATKLMEEVWRGYKEPTRTISHPSDSRFLALRNAAILEILFATGMRVGELVGLRVHDWREEDQCFLVKGKGSRQRLAFLPDDRSLMALQIYFSLRTAMELGHEFLIVNAAGAVMSTQGVGRIVARTAEDAGCTNRVTPHMIRHTVATLLLRYGADIRIVQEVLGHASIATTQRYTHVSKEHLVSALSIRHPNHHLRITWPGALERSVNCGVKSNSLCLD